MIPSRGASRCKWFLTNWGWKSTRGWPGSFSRITRRGITQFSRATSAGSGDDGLERLGVSKFGERGAGSSEEEGTRGPGCGRGPLTGSVSDESAASMPCAGDSGDEREEELPQSIA